MTNTLTVSSLERLLFAKNIFDHAENIAKDVELGLNRFNAVIQLDIAVENLLNVIYTDALSTNGNSQASGDRKSWDKLFNKTKQEVSQAISWHLPFYNELDTLHKDRNQAVHRGSMPSVSSVETGYNYAQSFFVDCFENCYGLDFSNVSMLEVITNDSVKNIFHQIHQLLQEGDLNWAAVGLTVCSGELDDSVRDKRDDILDTFQSMPMRTMDYNIENALRETLKEYSRILDEYFVAVNQETMFASIGINALESRRAWRIAERLPKVHIFSTDKNKWRIGRSFFNHNKEDLTFLFDYLLKLAYRLQSNYPDQFKSIQMSDQLLEYRKQDLF